MADNERTVRVSVVLPVRNEEKYIKGCINSILRQDFDKDNLEIVIIDGMSEDKTVEIIESFMARYKFIRLHKNPKKTIQYANNIGIKNAVGEYIVRMDAHSEYADDYILKCVEYLEKTGAENVGGPMIAKGKTPIQTVVAAAYHSPFALGGGKFHDEDYEGYADTVYLGAFRRGTLLKLGLYDERLIYTDDDDLNFRLVESGGKVFITPKIKSVYYPRASYTALFKQYFRYGFWKVAVIKKHKKPARLSHLVPAAFVAFLILSSILSYFSKLADDISSPVLLLYFAFSLYFSLKNARVTSFADKLRLVWVHFILHTAYGLGFLCGIFKFWRTDF